MRYNFLNYGGVNLLCLEESPMKRLRSAKIFLLVLMVIGTSIRFVGKFRDSSFPIKKQRTILIARDIMAGFLKLGQTYAFKFQC